jgi:hypothetical protein
MDAVYLYNGLYSEKMGRRGVCSQLQTVSRRPAGIIPHAEGGVVDERGKLGQESFGQPEFVDAAEIWL